MAPRRPPDILRKSHAHTEGKVRASDKRDLERELASETFRDSVSGTEQALLIDLDGVVYRGEQAIPGAAEAIAWLIEQQMPHLFVTNTTSRPRSALVEKLAGLGIEARAEDILTPPVAAAIWLHEAGCRRLRLLVPDVTRAEFSEFENVDDEAAGVDAVVVGDLGRDWTFDRLNMAFRDLMREPVPDLIALGMTRYWHAPDGLQLDTAPFVVALAHAAGVEPVVLGKPDAAFFKTALTRLGVEASRAAMIGDDIRADIGGAQAAGLAGILVKTGKYRPADLQCSIEPDLVLESIAELPLKLRNR